MSEDRSPQFGRVPYAVIASGALAQVRPAARAVYLVLAAHVQRPDDWSCSVGVRTIARLTGLMVGSVSRSIHELVDARLIMVQEGGNGRSNVIILATSPPGERSPGRERSSVHPGANGEESDRSPGRNGTVRATARNRSPRREQNRLNKLGNKQAACSVRALLARMGMSPRWVERVEAVGLTTAQLVALWHDVTTRRDVRKPASLMAKIALDDGAASVPALTLDAVIRATTGPSRIVSRIVVDGVEHAIDGHKVGRNGNGLYLDGALIVPMANLPRLEFVP